jgi:hypothetical protein
VCVCVCVSVCVVCTYIYAARAGVLPDVRDVVTGHILLVQQAWVCCAVTCFGSASYAVESESSVSEAFA